MLFAGPNDRSETTSNHHLTETEASDRSNNVVLRALKLVTLTNQSHDKPLQRTRDTTIVECRADNVPQVVEVPLHIIPDDKWPEKSIYVK